MARPDERFCVCALYVAVVKRTHVVILGAQGYIHPRGVVDEIVQDRPVNTIDRVIKHELCARNDIAALRVVFSGKPGDLERPRCDLALPVEVCGLRNSDKTFESPALTLNRCERLSHWVMLMAALIMRCAPLPEYNNLSFRPVVQCVRQYVPYMGLLDDQRVDIRRPRCPFMRRQRRDLCSQVGECVVNGIDALLGLGGRHRDDT